MLDFSVHAVEHLLQLLVHLLIAFLGLFIQAYSVLLELVEQKLLEYFTIFFVFSDELH